MPWTSKQQKRVHAWRRSPNPTPLDPNSLLAAVRKRFQAKRYAGSPDAPKAELTALAIARYGEREAATAGLDVEVEAIAATILTFGDRPDEYERLESLVDLWVATEGSAFAVRALAMHGNLRGAGTAAAYWVNVREQPHWLFASGFVGAWRRLRERLTEVSDSDYAAAREAADALRAQSTHQVTHCALAYAFPLESAWATREAAAPIQAITQSYGGSQTYSLPPLHLAALVSSIDDAEVMRPLVEKYRETVHTYDHLFTAVDRLGDGIFAIAPLFLHGASVQERLDVIEAFSRVEGPSYASLLVEMLSSAPTAAAARRMLSQDPTSAIVALAEAIAENPRRAKTHNPILTAIATKHPEIARAQAQKASAEAQKVLAPWMRDSDLLPAKQSAKKSKADSAAARGPWLDIESLPKPALVNGGETTSSEIRELIEALEHSRLDAPKPAIATALTKLEASSLEVLAWAIFDAWVAARAPSSGVWATFGLSFFGRDETPRRLTKIIRAWAGDGAIRAALVLVDALARIPSSATLVELHKLTGARQEIDEAAQPHLDRLLRQSGLGEEDLYDLLVPDCSLQSGGPVVLDFGKRTFEVRIDEHLAPSLFDASGKPIKTLPRPSKADDSKMAEAAREKWNDIKEGLRDTVAAESKRFERAMCSRRKWRIESFRDHVVRHPVLVRLARRLVWAFLVGDSMTTFRVAEDGTFTDHADEPLEIRGEISIPHPLEMESMRREWGSLFADYEIIEPFPQIGREVYRLEDGEREEEGLSRFKGAAVHSKTLYMLESKGWERIGEHYDPPTMQRLLADGVHQATVALTQIGDEAFEIRDVEVGEKLGRIDPIAMSELIRDLERTRI